MDGYTNYETVANPEIYSLNPYDQYSETLDVPEPLYSDDQYTSYGRTTQIGYDDYSPEVLTSPAEPIYYNDYQPQSYAAQSSVPFYGSTTTRDAYQWKDPITPRATRQRAAAADYNIESVPFYGETTTQAEYGKKIPLPINNYKLVLLFTFLIHSKPQREYSNPTVPFYSTTTHRDEFSEKKVEKVQRSRPEQTAGLSREIKFDGTTTHKDHYPVRELTRTKLVKPVQTVGILPMEKMVADTTHRIEFIQEKTADRARPVRQRGHDFFNGKLQTNYKTETIASFNHQQPTKNCPAEAIMNSKNMRARNINGHWFVARVQRRRPTSEPNAAKGTTRPNNK